MVIIRLMSQMSPKQRVKANSADTIKYTLYTDLYKNTSRCQIHYQLTTIHTLREEGQ